MSFVYEIGHSDIYGDHPGQFCLPGQSFCGSFNQANWAGLQPLRIFDATFGDGSHPEHWAAVSDTGGKAEILGNSFVGPTDCVGYGGPYCIYPWFSWTARRSTTASTIPTRWTTSAARAVREAHDLPDPAGQPVRNLQDVLRHDPALGSGASELGPRGPGSEAGTTGIGGGRQSGRSAVASISTFAPGSSRPLTSSRLMAG